MHCTYYVSGKWAIILLFDLTFIFILGRHLQVYCQNPQLKERLHRAASLSDRVGLMALVQRIANVNPDPVLFDIIRRLRASLG